MDRDVKTSSAAVTFSCTMTVFGFPITACVLIPDEGIQVCVWGGEKSHIGALSVIAPDGSRSDLQFPGHKDGVIASKWASALREAGYCPVAVSAGIHYDDLDRHAIRTVVEAADALLGQVLTQLRQGGAVTISQNEPGPPHTGPAPETVPSPDHIRSR